MKKINILLMFPLLLILLVSFTGCSEISYGFEEPQIISFNIIAANNTAISDDITGVIEERLEGGVIKITVPENFVFSNHLTPTITVSGDALVSPSSGDAQDFSVNPVTYTVYNENGGQSIYSIIVKRAVKQANPGDVFISEVFNGKLVEEIKSVRVDNGYIELYNNSSIELDLSQFSLELCNPESTEEHDYDFITELIGVIPAKSTFVIYNKDIDVAVMNSVNTPNSTSDINHNFITSLNGNESVLLLHNGVVIDVFDPSGNKPYINNYSRMKKFVRMAEKGVSTSWNDSDWILYPVEDDSSDDNTAGGHETDVDTTANDLTYFAFEEDLIQPFVGVIDNSTNAIKITLPGNVDPSTLKAVFGTDGQIVLVNGNEQVTGVTENDFTSPVVYKIWAVNGSVSTYTVTINTVSYTRENYTFDGNIQDVINEIGQSGDDVSLTTGSITGVVTAKDIGGSSFMLQDKNAGIYIYTSTGLDSSIEVGTKISIDVSTGKCHSDLVEITAYSNVKVLDTDLSIYYEIGNYAESDPKGKVYLYEGVIKEAMDKYDVGKFTNTMCFHGLKSLGSSLTVGTKAKFYGPVTHSYGNYRLEISSLYQISE